jgi:hypothetical protein
MPWSAVMIMASEVSAKLTAPGSAISSSGRPSGEKTWMPSALVA